ncbi:MAG TPA: ABC transporter ATP-binding protein, partial [Chthoniobacteraceae bacterium]|nr:ABC transporter ATP-binding protein [Chthoniobacteraceae bacterium]
MKPIVEVRDLSKLYRLGAIGATSLREALGRWFTRFPSAPQQLPGEARDLAGPEAGTFWALRDVSFDVERGEVVGIIGRNGAGKSTLLKVLSRITEPTAGRVVLRGRVASLLEVGTGFHPELTGRENIFLNGAILGMKRAEIAGKFDEIVAFAEVGAFIDTPVKRYSSGMYVRLAFAVVAHLEPEILIIDEVLAVGDTAFQKKCLGKMDEVARSGRTVLFVSHNLPAVQTLCSRAILIDLGRVVATGSVGEILTEYIGGKDERGTVWERPDSPSTPGRLRFDAARLALKGRQPRMQLELNLRVGGAGAHRPAFVAVDILDSLGTSIMQAVPTVTPFIHDTDPEHAVRILIDLPPLVPGHYGVTLWIGPHNSETFDFVERCLAFDIQESPTENRVFAHSPDHGAVVPESSVACEPMRRRS